MEHNTIKIIGVTPAGAAGLAAPVLEIIKGADMLFGGHRLLDMFPDIPADKYPVAGNLASVLDIITKNNSSKRIVVLASGDPGFHGIAGYLGRKLGTENIRVIPNISSVQAAFARIGATWHDAALLSAHGHDIRTILPDIARSDKIAVLTSDTNTPSAIAAVLLNRGLEDFSAYVCEDLGADNEKVEEYSLEDIIGRTFSTLSVLLLIRKQDAAVPYRYPGIPDDEFFQRQPARGLITKQEVRAISLSKLNLDETSVVWDIGAGSGAVSIEASLLAWRGTVCTVEKNRNDVENIKENIRKFHRYNIDIVEALAPDGLDTLPDPNAVFIGGSSGRMNEMIRYAIERMQPDGRIVINVVSLENLNAAVVGLKEAGLEPDITQVGVSRSSGVLNLTRLQALNPVFIISAAIPGKEVNQ